MTPPDFSVGAPDGLGVPALRHAGLPGAEAVAKARHAPRGSFMQKHAQRVPHRSAGPVRSAGYIALGPDA